jgi:hypothetical protein
MRGKKLLQCEQRETQGLNRWRASSEGTARINSVAGVLVTVPSMRETEEISYQSVVLITMRSFVKHRIK